VDFFQHLPPLRSSALNLLKGAQAAILIWGNLKMHVENSLAKATLNNQNKSVNIRDFDI
jgi:hypothetical protein